MGVVRFSRLITAYREDLCGAVVGKVEELDGVGWQISVDMWYDAVLYFIDELWVSCSFEV